MEGGTELGKAAGMPHQLHQISQSELALDSHSLAINAQNRSLWHEKVKETALLAPSPVDVEFV